LESLRPSTTKRGRTTVQEKESSWDYLEQFPWWCYGASGLL